MLQSSESFSLCTSLLQWFLVVFSSFTLSRVANIVYIISKWQTPRPLLVLDLKSLISGIQAMQDRCCEHEHLTSIIFHSHMWRTILEWPTSFGQHYRHDVCQNLFTVSRSMQFHCPIFHTDLKINWLSTCTVGHGSPSTHAASIFLASYNCLMTLKLLANSTELCDYSKTENMNLNETC